MSELKQRDGWVAFQSRDFTFFFGSRFLSALARNRIGFVRRYSGGPDIDAACGMLASRARGGSAHDPAAPGHAS